MPSLRVWLQRGSPRQVESCYGPLSPPQSPGLIAQGCSFAETSFIAQEAEWALVVGGLRLTPRLLEAF